MSDEDGSKLRGATKAVARAAPVIGIALLAFLLGALAARYGTWPYEPHVRRGLDAVDAVTHKASLGTPLATPYDSSLWRRVRFDGEGVVTHDRGRAYEGYTLLTSGHRRGATLLDMQGKTVHEWALEFDDIWPDPPHVPNPTPPGFIHWARVHMFADGNLLAVITSTEDSPTGYGLVRLDRDSNVVWAYADHAHHDFHVEPDESVWTLTAATRDLGDDPLPGFDRAHMLVDHFVVHLSADGEELTRHSLHDAMARSEYRGELFSTAVEAWDPLHPNHIHPAGEAFAGHHDFIEPDDLLISFRNIHAIVAFDPDDATIDWLATGRWRRQHDVDPMPDGTLLLYDNEGGVGTPGPSQILRYDPSDGAIEWSYTGEEERPFYSWIRGTQQPLPNGNVLFSDTENGRVVEVTASGDIVWEYLNPHRRRVDGQELTAVVESPVRYPLDYPEFL